MNKHFNLVNNYYQPSKQNDLSFTNYWRDPYQFKVYLTNSTYLAQLNQEIQIKIGQNTLDVLDNFIMIWSSKDEVLKPSQSGKFSFYKSINDKLEIVDLVDSDLYKSDFLKLKTMNEENRLHIYETNCLHSEHRESKCFDQLKPIFKIFL